MIKNLIPFFNASVEETCHLMEQISTKNYTWNRIVLQNQELQTIHEKSPGLLDSSLKG